MLPGAQPIKMAISSSVRKHLYALLTTTSVPFSRQNATTQQRPLGVQVEHASQTRLSNAAHQSTEPKKFGALIQTRA